MSCTHLQLENGLHFELQVWCKQVSLKAPTDTRPLVDYFVGGAYKVAWFWNMIEWNGSIPESGMVWLLSAFGR
jgi:hypothetical protein